MEKEFLWEKEFLCKEIENIRRKLELLFVSKVAVNEEILRVSDRLDTLIVDYLKKVRRQYR